MWFYNHKFFNFYVKINKYMNGEWYVEYGWFNCNTEAISLCR